MNSIHLSEKLQNLILTLYRGERCFQRQVVTPQELRKLCELGLVASHATGIDPETGDEREDLDVFILTMEGDFYAEQLIHERDQFWRMNRHDYCVAAFGAVLGAALSLVITLIVHFGFS